MRKDGLQADYSAIVTVSELTFMIATPTGDDARLEEGTRVSTARADGNSGASAGSFAAVL
jgi:hypothetical protein